MACFSRLCFRQALWLGLFLELKLDEFCFHFRLIASEPARCSIVAHHCRGLSWWRRPSLAWPSFPNTTLAARGWCQEVWGSASGELLLAQTTTPSPPWRLVKGKGERVFPLLETSRSAISSHTASYYSSRTSRKVKPDSRQRRISHTTNTHCVSLFPSLTRSYTEAAAQPCVPAGTFDLGFHRFRPQNGCQAPRRDKPSAKCQTSFMPADALRGRRLVQGSRRNVIEAVHDPPLTCRSERLRECISDRVAGLI